ncbi:MAG: cytochrome c3 family protein [Elusimicrobiota bacterium]|jgi:cytochrome b subunit of formate dehydrogenase
MKSAVLFLGLAVLAVPARAEDEACLACHGNKGTGAPAVRTADFHASAHKDIGCASCHAGKDDTPHDKKAAPVSCEGCHEKSVEILRASDHGKMLGKQFKGSALCWACHGPAHALRRAADPRSPVQRANIPATCDRCHQKIDFKGKFGLEPFSSYAQTVHGRALSEKKNEKAAVCVDCHGGHDLDFSNNSKSRANRDRIPKTCGNCHADALKAYSRSVHAQKARSRVKEAPVCTDCHGEHNIQGLREPGSMVFTGSIVKTCSHCHGSERLIAKFGMPLDASRTYLDSYHGVAFSAGNMASANCASCHRHHDVLPSSDPDSSVNEKNLQKTCGACHPRAGALVNLGKVHMTFSSTARDIRETVLSLVRKLYIYLIVLTIAGMLLHNLLDHKRKLLLGISHVHDPQELRMSANERIQHLVLMLSFFGLAYTGFCHAYPQASWARIAFDGASGAAWRAGLHRVFAGVFLLLAAYHLYWISSTRDGRAEMHALLPRWQDFLDFLRMQRYNLTHRGSPPERARFNYIEKAEYWALIWGSFVMVGTGFVVWFREWSLHLLPKWFIDLCLLIHFMEAVLACLAIAVWHSYWTVFDMDVYPMNWAWITGKVRLDRSTKPAVDKKEAPPDDPK